MSRPPAPRRTALVVGAVLLVLSGAVAGARVVLTADDERETDQPRAEPVLVCNGDEASCDLTIDQAVFPGTHNSMSSVAYPGWLFGQQSQRIRGQLDAGIRALLVDAYYGDLDEERSDQTGRPVVLTAEAGGPDDIFLCHVRCETGALPFGDALAEVEGFLEAKPAEVVIVIIQDATAPADTSAAIAAAGLADRTATLRAGQPLPTLGDLVRSGRTLLVFAEKGGPGAPPWYHRAFEWFQETPFDFTDAARMGCEANRGRAGAPLFLINHWLASSPPDPAIAATVNARPPLEERFNRCQAERGRLPNVVAVDFADQGGVVSTLRDLNQLARPAG